MFRKIKLAMKDTENKKRYFYVHFDNFGRPNEWTGFKSVNQKKAIKFCSEMKPKGYVSKLNVLSNLFDQPIYCNFKEIDK